MKLFAFILLITIAFSNTAPILANVTVIDTIAHLQLSDVPVGATIKVDGIVYQSSNIEIDLQENDTKDVDLTVIKSGYRTYRAKVTLTHGETTHITVEMPQQGQSSGNQQAPKGIPIDLSNNAINTIDKAELVYIPAGIFIMGEDNGVNSPKHNVYLDGYYIYRNLVTVGMYKKFCAATHHKMPTEPEWGWENQDYPIVNVTWNDAVAYCAWAGSLLPTEAQWEKAARGTDGRMFPWGNAWNPMNCNHSKESVSVDGTPTAIGMYPNGASPNGILDMVGSVNQWCRDWCDLKYYNSSPSRNPKGPLTGEYRVTRGGSFHYGEPTILTCTCRNGIKPDQIMNDLGFRCVIEKQ